MTGQKKSLRWPSMPDRRPEEPRRASVTMYDPARDIYTVSGEQDRVRSAERDESHRAEQRDATKGEQVTAPDSPQRHGGVTDTGFLNSSVSQAVSL